MKKQLLLGSLLVASVGFFAMQKSGDSRVESYGVGGHFFSAGAPQERTGAPLLGGSGNELNCTACHVGTVQSGTGVNDLVMNFGGSPVTTYLPGNTYQMVLTLGDANVKEGFQATVIDDATLNMAGSFSAGTGTAITTSGGSLRDYANHTSGSNTNANPNWIWTWNAPSTDVGPVTFYVATNVANGNASQSGDVIYLSQHTYNVDASAEVEQHENFEDFTASFVVNARAVRLEFNSRAVGEMFFNLVDLNGRSVFTQGMGEAVIGKNSTTVQIPESVKSGIYMVNFFVGNNPMSAKVLVK